MYNLNFNFHKFYTNTDPFFNLCTLLHYFSMFFFYIDISNQLEELLSLNHAQYCMRLVLHLVRNLSWNITALPWQTARQAAHCCSVPVAGWIHHCMVSGFDEIFYLEDIQKNAFILPEISPWAWALWRNHQETGFARTIKIWYNGTIRNGKRLLWPQIYGRKT